MSFVIRLENLPWSADCTDISHFFDGIEIPDENIHIVGGVKGIAFIALKCENEAKEAMLRDGLDLLENPIKLFFSDDMELKEVVGRVRKGFIDKPAEAFDDHHTTNENFQSPERTIQKRSSYSGFDKQSPNREISPCSLNPVPFPNRNKSTAHHNYLFHPKDVFHAESPEEIFSNLENLTGVPQQFKPEVKYPKSTERFERKYPDQPVLNIVSRPSVPLQKSEFDSFSKYAATSRNEDIPSNFSSGKMNKDVDSEFPGSLKTNKFTSFPCDFHRPSTSDFCSPHMRNKNVEFTDFSLDYRKSAEMSFDAHKRSLPNESLSSAPILKRRKKDLSKPPDELEEPDYKFRKTKENFQSWTKTVDVGFKNVFNKYEDYPENHQVGREQNVQVFDYPNLSSNVFSVDVKPVSLTKTDDISAKQLFNKYKNYPKSHQFTHEQNIEIFDYSNRSCIIPSVDIKPVLQFEKPNLQLKTKESFQFRTKTDDINAKKVSNTYEDYRESYKHGCKQKNIEVFDYSNHSCSVSSVDVNRGSQSENPYLKLSKTEESFQPYIKSDNVSAKKMFNKCDDYPESQQVKQERNVRVFDYSLSSCNVPSVNVNPVSDFENKPAVLSFDSVEYTKSVDLEFNENVQYSRNIDQKLDKNITHPININQSSYPNNTSSQNANVESYSDPFKNDSPQLNTVTTTSEISDKNKNSFEKLSYCRNKNTTNKQSEDQEFSPTKPVRESNFQETEQKTFEEMKKQLMTALNNPNASDAPDKLEEKFESRKILPIKNLVKEAPTNKKKVKVKVLVKKVPTEDITTSKISDENTNSDKKSSVGRNKNTEKKQSENQEFLSFKPVKEPNFQNIEQKTPEKFEMKQQQPMVKDSKVNDALDEPGDKVEPRKFPSIRFSEKSVKEVPTKNIEILPIRINLLDKKLVKEVPGKTINVNKIELKSSDQQDHVLSNKKHNNLKTKDSKTSNFVRDISKKEFVSSNKVKPTTDVPKNDKYVRDDKIKDGNSNKGYRISSPFNIEQSGDEFQGSRSPDQMRKKSKDNEQYEVIDPQSVFGKPGCVVEASNVNTNANLKELLNFFDGFELDDIIRKFTEAGVPTEDIRIAFRSCEEAQLAVLVLNYRTLRGVPIRMHIV